MEYKNLFANIPKEDICRSTLQVPFKLKAEFESYDPRQGTIQTTISILLTKLIDELKRTGIEKGDRYAYQAAVAG